MTTSFIKSYIPRIAAPLVAGVFAAATFLPAVASAQAGPGGGEIQGVVQSIDGTFNITVQDDQGYDDAVQLHQGTIINPTGLTLAPGMSVTIQGYSNGSEFDANEIDTPYQYTGAAPVPVYYGPGVWYPGFNPGYGPSFSLVFSGGPVLVQRPWIGRWYQSTPIRAYGYGYRPPVVTNRDRRYPEGPAYRQPQPGSNFRQTEPAYRQPAPGYHQTQPGPTFRQEQPAQGFRQQQPAPAFRQQQPSPAFRQQQPAPAFRQQQPAQAFRRQQPVERAAPRAAPAQRTFSAERSAPRGGGEERSADRHH